MLVVKMMGSENLADSHTAKSYELYHTSYVKFGREKSFNLKVDDKNIEDKPVVYYDKPRPFMIITNTDGQPEKIYITGNVYVMENGHTVSSFAYSMH